MSINQRLKDLIDKLNLTAKAFSEAINESPTNTSNYTGKRQAEPRAQYLSKVLFHFGHVNARWLMTGEGQPFGPEIASGANGLVPTNKNFKNSIVVSGNVGGSATQNRGASATEAAMQREIEFLQAQVAEKERTIQILLSKS